MKLPTPHYDKYTSLLENPDLPQADKKRLENAASEYDDWISRLESASGSRQEIIEELAEALTEYKLFVDLNLIFDSEANFLRRGKGQSKISSSIIEEFLPWLVVKSFEDQIDVESLRFGPTRCFSSVYFESSLTDPAVAGGFRIRTKDQDFAISRQVFLKSSYDPDFDDSRQDEISIAYVAVETKTNLDKTMFQEAASTANDVTSAVTGSKYILFCEWLDMTPISTSSTDIDEVLILRKARRISSSVRGNFSTVRGRKEHRDEYEEHLRSNPISADVLARFVDHISDMLDDGDPAESRVLSDGYF